MKKISKLVAVAMLLTAIPFTSVKAQEVDVEESSKTTLTSVLNEEKQAKKMYEDLNTKYPEVAQFEKLIKAEQNHINSAQRVMDRLNVTATEESTALTIPDDKTQAIQFALDFETNDVKELEARLQTETNEDVKRLLTNLKNASEKHKESLERAISGDYSMGFKQGRNMNFEKYNRNMNNELKNEEKMQRKQERMENRDPEDCISGTPGEGPKDGTGIGAQKKENGHGKAFNRNGHGKGKEQEIGMGQRNANCDGTGINSEDKK